MSNVFVSLVCRVTISPLLLALAATKGPGKHVIPTHILDPRQIKLNRQLNCDVPVVLKWHRDAYVPCISRDNANKHVTNGLAEFLEQSLLVYSMEDYLKDPDTLKLPSELQRAQESGADLVIVAVIGENRSALSVCRNIASGCQDREKLVEEALGAIAAANTILIED